MDFRVLDVQRWLNETYGSNPGFNIIPETEFGKTGYKTVWALIRALQIELGITTTADTFGPTTERYFNEKIGALRRQENFSPPTNLNYILQGAFYCKGYNPGGFTGNFYDYTEHAVKEFQGDIGFPPEERDGAVTAKIMKALLNTDGYRLNAKRGKDYIRFIQQRLNIEYANHGGNKWYFDYIPTDGVYGRATNTALIYALQIEEGLGDIANGNFGPSTWSNCPTLLYGDTGPFVKLLQWALACNGEEYYTEFDGVYDYELEEIVRNFQDFMALPPTGVADRGTIKQTLTSNGDINRIAIACDTATIIDEYKADTLKEHGYRYVGRYLTGNVRTSSGAIVSKAMTPEELEIMHTKELCVFPIYQDGGYYVQYFSDENGKYKYGRGYEDAYRAVHAAKSLGFPHLVTIYFAVDFDAYDYQVTDLILPYFREIRQAFNELFSNPKEFRYLLGVYGPRNICIRVSEDPDILADRSFVANMSTGYSGNLGFPMPKNWAFDQFHEYSIGQGQKKIGIDKCGFRGIDLGTNFVLPPPALTYSYIRDRWIDIATKIPPIVGEPRIFSTQFEFDSSRELIIESPLLTVYLTTQLGTITLGDDIPTFRVSNGTFLELTTEELLGDAFLASVGVDIFNNAGNMIDSLAHSIEFGQIGITVDNSNPSQIVIKLKIIEEDIPIDYDGDKTNLGILLEFIIKQNLEDPNNEDSNPFHDVSFEWEVWAIFAFFLRLFLFGRFRVLIPT